MSHPDLKIELNKFYALNKSCLELEYGARRIVEPNSQYQTFNACRFVFSYFTFNTIYAVNWKQSFEKSKIYLWSPFSRDRENYRQEAGQFNELLDFYYEHTSVHVSTLLKKNLENTLRLFDIRFYHDYIKGAKTTNEDTKSKELRKNLLDNYAGIINPTGESETHLSAWKDVLTYIYKVRNNVFHGTKSRMEMAEVSQQRRLLIYAATLIATNSVLFDVVEAEKVGWKKPDTRF